MPDDQSTSASSSPVLSPLAQHLTAAIAGVAELERLLSLAQSNRDTLLAERNSLSNQLDDAEQAAIELRARVDNYEHTIGELRTESATLRAEVERLKGASSGQPIEPPTEKPVDPKPTAPDDKTPNILIQFGPTELRLMGVGSRWRSERRWAFNVDNIEKGLRLCVDVHDSGQVRVFADRGLATLSHTAPVLTLPLRVVIDGKTMHDASLRVDHHQRPPLVFNRREPDKSKALSVATMARSALLPILPYHQIDVPETELARIAFGGGNWPKWSAEMAKTTAVYDPISEEYGQVVRSWVGGAGPLLNEAGMLMPVQVAYLLSRDPRAWAEVVRLADSSGNYAVHYRLPDGRFPRADETADLPFLNREEHVALTTAAGVKLPIPDVAHQHSLVYLAYLLTGERYYYEELCSWWTWNLLTRPKNADRLQGIIWSGQVRAAAWALRSLLHLVLASDQEPDKTHYQLLLVRNLAWMRDTFTRPNFPHYRPTGIVQLDAWRASAMLQFVRAEPKPQWFATWQLHVMVFVLHECVRAGYEEAIPMRDHLLKVAEACWSYSPSRYLAPWGNHAVPVDLDKVGNLDAWWKTIMRATFEGMPASDPHRTAFLDPITPDYIAWFRAACVVGVDTGQAWAKEALAWLDAEVPKSRWKALPYEWRVQPGATA